MRNLKLLAATLLLAFTPTLVSACEDMVVYLRTGQTRAQLDSFTLLLEAVERTAGALSASKGQYGVTLDDIVDAFAEFPGNGFELTQSLTEVTVTVSTGMYAGCSATFAPTSGEYGVSIDDIVCAEPRADAPTPEPVN